VPAGEVLLGTDLRRSAGPALPDEVPQHAVSLATVSIGATPVTNAQYRAFVEDTGYRAPAHWPAADMPDALAEHPVTYVDWFDARAFCAWAGARLPSEAEWERAARGADARLYPWGDEPPSARPYAGYDVKSGGPDRVGANEPNDFGLYDMSEGVHEWCSDYYAYDYYRCSPERNPQGPDSGERRVSRGGSWRHHVKFSRCAARSSLPPDFKYADYGFRVALTLS